MGDVDGDGKSFLDGDCWDSLDGSHAGDAVGSQTSIVVGPYIGRIEPITKFDSGFS